MMAAAPFARAFAAPWPAADAAAGAPWPASALAAWPASAWPAPAWPAPWQAQPAQTGGAPAAVEQRTLADEFVRGFVTSGLLAALQSQGYQPRLDRRTLRLAVQGGAALASGVAAMRALRGTQYAQALLSVAAGAAAVAAAEYFLQTPHPSNQETAHGQEPD